MHQLALFNPGPPRPSRPRVVGSGRRRFDPEVSWWRREATPVAARVLVATRGMGPHETRRALASAYPFTFHGRRGWPYKVWLSEIKRLRAMPPEAVDALDARGRRLAGER